MTRAEIEGLSGRALDAAVAEQVMGLALCPNSDYYMATEVVPCPDGRDGCLVIHYGQVPRLVHRYSTTWPGLGLVVARLASMVGDDGDHPDIVIEANGVRTMVTIGPIGSHLMTTTVDGPPDEAAPTAVARVALLVAGATHA